VQQPGTPHLATMRIFALMLLLLATPLAAQDFPKLSGRVVDAADILPADVEAAIDARSAAIEAQTGAQLVVATVPSLQGYEIEEYGYRLGRAWGIGQKREAGPTGAMQGDNGVILLVAPNDRKVRIEVGYGLEPVLTDALSSVIIQRQILPSFRAGDMAGGVSAGFEAIARQVELPPDEAAANVQRATQDMGGADGAGIVPLLIFLLFLWIIFSRLNRRGRRMAGTSGPIVIWGPGSGGSWGSGRGGGWGGGGGGFGGGGASGGW